MNIHAKISGLLVIAALTVLPACGPCCNTETKKELDVVEVVKVQEPTEVASAVVPAEQQGATSAAA
jgi:hypothetical protein